MVETSAPQLGSVRKSWPQDSLRSVQPALVSVRRQPALRTDLLFATDRQFAPIDALHVRTAIPMVGTSAP